MATYSIEYQVDGKWTVWDTREFVSDKQALAFARVCTYATGNRSRVRISEERFPVDRILPGYILDANRVKRRLDP